MFAAHGERFQLGCRWCTCYAGEAVCHVARDGDCAGADYNTHAPAQNQLTRAPCNCHTHHVPVCGKNGKTYPNSCVARYELTQSF